MAEKVTPKPTDVSHDGDIIALAKQLDIRLDDTQLNVGGERSIMSPNKFVLTGIKTATADKVVLKCAKEQAGIDEITQEHNVRQCLKGLPFAEQELIMPEEVFYGQVGDYTISVTVYVEQAKVFTDFTIEQQFFMALQALECQESFHATTREHQLRVTDSFTSHTPAFYTKDAADMCNNIERVWPDASQTLRQVIDFITSNESILQAFDGYVIHSDFVPHNFRIKERQLYLLDFVSFRLANKYESWARFINFMEIHSPKLVPLLTKHIKNDRGDMEYQSLQLMRAYKILFLLNYYAKTITKTTGDLKALTTARLDFWTHVLQAVLDDVVVPADILDRYYQERTRLRTPEEVARQKQFTWA